MSRTRKSAPPPPPRGPFPNIPRRLLNVAAIGGGLVGIILSQVLGWSAIEGFLFTLLIAGGCVLLVAVGYAIVVNRNAS